MSVIRKTKAVRLILDVFEKSEVAFSSVDLIEKFKDTMNKTTVYRILGRLENDGILHSFTGNDGVLWYAKCHGCLPKQHSDIHPHFQCSRCGKTKCLDMEISIPEISNHSIEKAEFLLVGKCEDCIK
jgi:Fur family ferric uptake transcriptional regulator